MGILRRKPMRCISTIVLASFVVLTVNASEIKNEEPQNVVEEKSSSSFFDVASMNNDEVSSQRIYTFIQGFPPFAPLVSSCEMSWNQ